MDCGGHISLSGASVWSGEITVLNRVWHFDLTFRRARSRAQPVPSTQTQVPAIKTFMKSDRLTPTSSDGPFRLNTEVTEMWLQHL